MNSEEKLPDVKNLLIRTLSKTHLIYESGPDFESLTSAKQDLTFHQAKQVFEEREISFHESDFANLGLRNPKTTEYTNLAYLLSDQNPWTVKTAFFKNILQTDSAISREFSGSVLKQGKDAIDYFIEHDKGRTAAARAPEHTGAVSFPPQAVHEAIINALVHRDYGIKGDTIINMTDEYLEVLSVGGLPVSLTKEQILEGFSVSRNPKLAGIFHMLHFADVYGTGIRRIFKSYANTGKEPEIQVFEHGFKVILPNLNFEDPDNTPDLNLNPQMKKIFRYLEEHESITLPETEVLLDVKTARVYAITNEMMAMGLLACSGRGKKKIYFLSKTGKKDTSI